VEKLTENQMREYFENSGLTYATDVTYDKVTLLHSFLTQELFCSDNFNGSYRMNSKIEFKTKRNKARDFIYAGLTCNSFYFTGREAVSFNGHGFIGFCGWSDSVNNQPILRAFKKWVDFISRQHK
jgi:hypothetical protein